MYSSSPYTNSFHFNFLCKSNRIKYRPNAGIKAQFIDLLQTILHFWPFKYDYRARDASSDHHHPAIGNFKPYSTRVVATKLWLGRVARIILVLKTVLVLHHAVHQMMQ
jgi:hypothetical protein